MQDKIECLLRKSKIIESEGSSILGGCNEGRLPRHRFLYREPEVAPVLSVYTAGIGYWGDNVFRYRRDSNTFALELVIEGEFLFTDNGVHYAAPPGCLFIVHLHHDIEMMCTTTRARKRTIILNGQLLEAIVTSLRLNDCAFIKLSDPDEIEAKFMTIEKLLLTGDSASLRQADAAAYELLLHLVKEISSAPIPEKMLLLMEMIDNNLNQMLTVEDLARNLHVSKATIYRMFRDHCHCTPLAYMTNKRMTMAEWMLRHSERSIKEIAAALGYKNQLYFSTSFKKYHQLSPKNFRRRLTAKK